MKVMVRNLIVSAALGYSLVSSALAQNIDVLIGAAPQAAGMQNAFSAATDLALKMPLIMLNNGTPSNVYRFGAYPLVVGFQTEGTATSSQAVNYLYSPLAEAGPFLRSRENAPIPVLPGLPPPLVTGFDIVVMLVSSIESNSGDPNEYACGATYTNTNLLDPLGLVQFSSSDRYDYYAIVLSLDSRCRLDITLEGAFMHEMGHVMGGRHQTTATPQVAYTKPYEDSPVLGPTRRTAMWTPWEMAKQKEVYSSANFDFPGTSIARGDFLHDMARFVGERWNHVSAYLPIPQVEECIINFTPICGEPFSGIISPVLSGNYTISSIDVDFSVGGTGPWGDVYEGPQTCPGFMSNALNLFRAIIETNQGISYCQASFQFVYQPAECGSGGGGIFN